MSSCLLVLLDTQDAVATFFPDISSITPLLFDKSSTILGPGKLSSLHCIPILLYTEFLNLGSLDIGAG